MGFEGHNGQLALGNWMWNDSAHHPHPSMMSLVRVIGIVGRAVTVFGNIIPDLSAVHHQQPRNVALTSSRFTGWPDKLITHKGSMNQHVIGRESNPTCWGDGAIAVCRSDIWLVIRIIQGHHDKRAGMSREISVDSLWKRKLIRK